MIIIACSVSISMSIRFFSSFIRRPIDCSVLTDTSLPYSNGSDLLFMHWSKFWYSFSPMSWYLFWIKKAVDLPWWFLGYFFLWSQEHAALFLYFFSQRNSQNFCSIPQVSIRIQGIRHKPTLGLKQKTFTHARKFGPWLDYHPNCPFSDPILHEWLHFIVKVLHYFVWLDSSSFLRIPALIGQMISPSFLFSALLKVEKLRIDSD